MRSNIQIVTIQERKNEENGGEKIIKKIKQKIPQNWSGQAYKNDRLHQVKYPSTWMNENPHIIMKCRGWKEANKSFQSVKTGPM